MQAPSPDFEALVSPTIDELLEEQATLQARIAATHLHIVARWRAEVSKLQAQVRGVELPRIISAEEGKAMARAVLRETSQKRLLETGGGTGSTVCSEEAATRHAVILEVDADQQAETSGQAATRAADALPASGAQEGMDSADSSTAAAPASQLAVELTLSVPGHEGHSAVEPGPTTLESPDAAAAQGIVMDPAMLQESGALPVLLRSDSRANKGKRRSADRHHTSPAPCTERYTEAAHPQKPSTSLDKDCRPPPSITQTMPDLREAGQRTGRGNSGHRRNSRSFTSYECGQTSHSEVRVQRRYHSESGGCGSRRISQSQASSSGESNPSRQGSLDVSHGFRSWPIWDSTYSSEGWEAASNLSSQPTRRNMLATAVQKLNLTDPCAGDLSSSTFLQIFQHYAVHPSGLRRLGWVLFGMFLVSYDMVMTPFSVFFLQESHLAYAMSWLAVLFWTGDFGLSFFVGYHDKASNLELRIEMTARHYAKRWMAFDLILVLLDWFAVIARQKLGSDGSYWGTVGTGRMVRSVRLLRGLCLLRAIRLPKSFKHVIELMGLSEYSSLTISLCNHMFGILLINHVIACLWYLIGSRTGGWVGVYATGETVAMLYFTSLHWSLTQFTPATMSVQPQNFPERVFSVAILLFALLAFSSLISSITNLMTHLRNLRSVETKHFLKLDRYLRDHCISLSLSVRIRRYLEHMIEQQHRNLPEKEVELLQKISTPLQMELRYELHFPVLSKHPLFQVYATTNRPVVHRICQEALKSVLLCAGDVLFSLGDTAWGMYIVDHGVLCYAFAATVRHCSGSLASLPETLKPGNWFCESVLWTPWEHRGEMRALTESGLLALEAEKFHKILFKNRTAAQQLAVYASEAVDRLNQIRRADLTDLDDTILDTEAMIHRAFDAVDEDDHDRPATRNWLSKMASPSGPRSREPSLRRSSLMSAVQPLA